MRGRDRADARPSAPAPASPLRPLVATVVLLALLSGLGLPLRTAAAPQGIVSLQLATDVDAAARILASWATVTRSRLLLIHAPDLLLPVAYALTLVRMASRRALSAPRLHRAARTVAVTAVVAAVADQVENAAMAVTLLAGPTAVSVGVTRPAAVLKFVALGAALSGLALLTAWGRRAPGGPA